MWVFICRINAKQDISTIRFITVFYMHFIFMTCTKTYKHLQKLIGETSDTREVEQIKTLPVSLVSFFPPSLPLILSSQKQLALSLSVVLTPSLSTNHTYTESNVYRATVSLSLYNSRTRCLICALDVNRWKPKIVSRQRNTSSQYNLLVYDTDHSR